MFVGMLTGRPAEEIPGSTGDLLPKLLQLHKRVRQVRPGLVAVRIPARRHGRARGDSQVSAVELPIMEDIGLPTRCKGGLGPGEDTIHKN